MVTAMMTEIKSKIDTVFDLEDMVNFIALTTKMSVQVVTLLEQDKELLCEIFIRCGNTELAFIRNSGCIICLSSPVAFCL